MIRHFIVLFGAACLLATSPILCAQSVRILTAQADGLDAMGGELPPTDAQARRLAEIAETFRTVDADLIVVDRIPNRLFALKLAALIKPAVYQLTLFSTFPNTTAERNAPVSTTILSKRQPFGARSAEWRSTGQIELPGGFAFAGFRSGTNAFCFYAADLPGDGAPSASVTTNSLALRKRELAAQYLAHHIQWLGTTFSNQFTAFCVIGDFAADPRTGHLENAGRILQQAGFGAWLAPAAPEPGAAIPAPYSALLARNASLQSAPTILPQRTLRQPVCVYEINPGGKPGAFASTVTGRTDKAARTPGAMVIWIWLGVIVAVSALTAAIWWTLRRGNPGPALFHPQDSSQLVLDVDEVPIPSTADADSLRVETAMGQQRPHNTGQQNAANGAEARAGSFQHFHALLRERLVSWLSAQRGRLLASQDAGTQQVIELEGRLVRIQGHFEEQIQGRDQRIAELEQVIQVKENLIRKLLLARANPTSQTSVE